MAFLSVVAALLTAVLFVFSTVVTVYLVIGHAHTTTKESLMSCEYQRSIMYFSFIEGIKLCQRDVSEGKFLYNLLIEWLHC